MRDGTIKDLIKDCDKSPNNMSTVVNFHYLNIWEYPHMNNLKKLSSLLTYSTMLVSCLICTCLSLSLWLKVWLAHCISRKNKLNLVCVNTRNCKLKQTTGSRGYHHLFILHLFRRALWFMITYLMFFDWLFST